MYIHMKYKNALHESTFLKFTLENSTYRIDHNGCQFKNIDKVVFLKKEFMRFS